jgi:hypothetical protein
MIKQIITKEKVLADPINQIEDYVILTLKNIDNHGPVIHATSEYQAKSGGVIKEVSASFTKEEANQLFVFFQIPQGLIMDMFDELAIKTLMARLGQEHFFGLDASGWEDYVEPIIETPTE